mmetsp:Transcript_112947/g.269167  ORF Transcript_112947/g.269167 Transcript_112947/m.269167 type:complete len:201 (+) Transcript_112947:208-810(+)
MRHFSSVLPKPNRRCSSGTASWATIIAFFSGLMRKTMNPSSSVETSDWPTAMCKRQPPRLEHPASGSSLNSLVPRADTFASTCVLSSDFSAAGLTSSHRDASTSGRGARVPLSLGFSTSFWAVSAWLVSATISFASVSIFSISREGDSVSTVAIDSMDMDLLVTTVSSTLSRIFTWTSTFLPFLPFFCSAFPSFALSFGS